MRDIQLFLINTLMVSTAALTLIGCGTKIGTGANVEIQFKNNTGAVLRAEMEHLGVLGWTNFAAPAAQTPEVYQMKLVTIYMVEDIDPVTSNNAGAATRIWTSKKCDADLTLCGIAANAAPYIVDYFDLAAGTAAVNQTLADYKRDTKESTVNPGTYRYLRMDFSGKVIAGVNDTEPNLKFGMTGDVHEVRAQTYAVLVTFTSPFVLAEGESFTVNLAYDLDGRYYSAAASSSPQGSDPWTCESTGSAVPCISEAPFSPTVIKN